MVRTKDNLSGTALAWRTSVDGRIIDWHHEPDTSLWQRIEVDLLSFLPIEDQL